MMLYNGKFLDEMLHQVIKFELNLDNDNDNEIPDVILKKMPHAEYIKIRVVNLVPSPWATLAHSS